MQTDNTAALDFLRRYGNEVDELSGYIPYFEAKGESVASEYNGEYGKSNLRFAVYDSTLLGFVNRARKMRLMDKNYIYTYTRNRIKTHEQERELIGKASLKDVDMLRAFLSRYVLEGQRKGYLWQEASRENIFALVLKKLKEIKDFYVRS